MRRGDLTLATRPELARASRSALRLLREQTGHDLWMLTQVVRDECLVLDCADARYGIRAGDVFPWSATVDALMTNGRGPRIAPSVLDVPAYADLPIVSMLPVGSYAGAPLVIDGALYGTLTGLHPVALPTDVVRWEGTVAALADLLAVTVALESKASDQGRRAERAEVEAHVDQLTQLGNRLAWTKVLAEEEERCRRYGRPACIISVDLDGLKRANDAYGHAAGDRLIATCALVLRRVSRLCDQVARVGGDEFALLAVEANELDGRALLDRIADAFQRAGIEASLGIAVREGDVTLEETWRTADLAMYRHKRRLKVAAALAGVDLARGTSAESVAFG